MTSIEKLKVLRDVCDSADAPSNAAYRVARAKTTRVLAAHAALSLAAALAVVVPAASAFSIPSPDPEAVCIPGEAIECMDPFVYNE